jgi:hypothetical protein
MSAFILVVYLGGVGRGFELKKGWLDSFVWPYELGRYLFNLCDDTTTGE